MIFEIMIDEELRAYLEGIDPRMILFSNEDEAILGWTEVKQSQTFVAVYSYDKLVENMMKRDGVSRAVAVEYVDFNIVGAYLGDHTPIIVNKFYG